MSESFKYGLPAAATEYDGINKYLRITDIDNDSRLFKIDKLTSPNFDLNGADDYLLQYGDVLFANTGASVGKSYFHRDICGKVYFAGYLVRLRIKKEHFPKFVYQITFSDEYDKKILITSQRSAQPGVNAKEYSNFKFYIPFFKEQVKIGQLLEKFDSLITLYQRKYEKLVSIKKSLLSKMFPNDGEVVPKIRFKGFTNAWERYKFGNIATKFEYGLPAPSTEYDGINIYLRISDIDENSRLLNIDKLASPKINLNGLDNYLLTKGDILLPRTGSVSKTYIYNEKYQKIYFDGHLIRPKLNKNF